MKLRIRQEHYHLQQAVTDGVVALIGLTMIVFGPANAGMVGAFFVGLGMRGMLHVEVEP